jgi:hypothetical protein
MRRAATTFLLLQIASGGCASEHPLWTELALDQHTESLEGWFSAKGEWTVFPSHDLGSYDPFKAQGNGKCVSLVNGTSSPRADYSTFDGRKVILKGFATSYDDLESGTSPSDRLLSKRYWGGEVVENFCLRDLVFVVRDLRLGRRAGGVPAAEQANAANAHRP